eukprot:15358978-Ditylum_brightwellii.AAC.1
MAMTTVMIIVDVDQGVPKVYMDLLPNFSGNPINFEDWERKARATIQQTAYKSYLSCSATTGDKLGKLEGTDWSDNKKVQEFKDKVTNKDYDMECCVHTGNFKELINLIQKFKAVLSERSGLKKRRRRFIRDDDKEEESPQEKKATIQSSSKDRIPFIPRFLYNLLDQAGKRNMTTWRSM